MRIKKFPQKLNLNKSTIANLEIPEKKAVKGGYVPTDDGTCESWCEGCESMWPSCYGTCNSCGAATCRCLTINFCP